MSSAQVVGGEGRPQEGLRLSGWRPAGDQRAREDFVRGGMNVTWFTLGKVALWGRGPWEVRAKGLGPPGEPV